MQKHTALLDASDTEATDSLDLWLTTLDDYITACSDRFLEARRQVPAGKWTNPKSAKPDDYWTSLNDEEQFRVIGFALFKDEHGVTDIKGFHGRSKLDSGP
jgi:hypothetical protein